MDKIMTDEEWRMISAESRAKINVYSMNMEREITMLKECLRIAMEALTIYSYSGDNEYYAREAITRILEKSMD